MRRPDRLGRRHRHDGAAGRSHSDESGRTAQLHGRTDDRVRDGKPLSARCGRSPLTGFEATEISAWIEGEEELLLVGIDCEVLAFPQELRDGLQRPRGEAWRE